MSHPERPALPQIDPSDGYAYYQILDGSTVLCEFVATRLPDPSYGSGMVGGMEYWKIPGEALKTAARPRIAVRRVRSGTWTAAGPPPFKAANASFSTPVDVIWAGAAAASCHKSSSSSYGFALDLAIKMGKWQGTMNFYRSTADPVFAKIPDGTSELFNLWTSSYPQSCAVLLP